MKVTVLAYNKGDRFYCFYISNLIEGEEGVCCSISKDCEKCKYKKLDLVNEIVRRYI